MPAEDMEGIDDLSAGDWQRRWWWRHRQLGGVNGGSLAAEGRLQLSGGYGSTAAVAVAAVVAV